MSIEPNDAPVANDRRREVEAEYGLYETFPKAIRDLMKVMNFTLGQMKIVQGHLANFDEATVKNWLENLADGQLPGWRGWK